MLREIEAMLRKCGPTAVADIAIHFDSTPEAIQGMLETLAAKGRVEKTDLACDKGCPGCASDSATEIWKIAE